MRIRRKFLQLTRYTYPHGTEGFLKSYLPEGSIKDSHGNYYYLVGENPTAMFTCHLDTACGTQNKVNHVIHNNIVKTDGKTILGADDKAGMVVLLYMIENKVPGLYYFFIGEEVGCIGSGKLAGSWSDSQFSHTISKVVSFDRRSDCSVITDQWYGRCCSDEFAEELSIRLNTAGYNLKLAPDDTGVLTDSAQFMDIVPECTNISVGYGLEHTTSEYQDIDFLSRLCKSVVKIDWETLPVMRNPYDVENDSPGWDDEDDYEYDFGDDEYVEDFYSYFQIGKEVKKMHISKYIIENESNIIREWIKKTDGYSDITDINWNGNSLYVNNVGGGYTFVGKRIDLMEMISELGSVPSSKIKEKVKSKSNFREEDKKYHF